MNMNGVSIVGAVPPGMKAPPFCEECTAVTGNRTWHRHGRACRVAYLLRDHKTGNHERGLVSNCDACNGFVTL